VTVFDHGRSVREDEIRLSGGTFRFQRCGANHSRRYYRQDSLLNMRVSVAFGGLGNPGIKAIVESDAVLDVSGADRFADLYAKKRFQTMTQTKRFVLDLSGPHILLPKTLGPFDQPASSQTRVRSHMARARDARSYQILREFRSDQLDPARCRVGVGMAFAMPPRRNRSSAAAPQ